MKLKMSLADFKSVAGAEHRLMQQDGVTGSTIHVEPAGEYTSADFLFSKGGELESAEFQVANHYDMDLYISLSKKLEAKFGAVGESIDERSSECPTYDVHRWVRCKDGFRYQLGAVKCSVGTGAVFMRISPLVAADQKVCTERS